MTKKKHVTTAKTNRNAENAADPANADSADTDSVNADPAAIAEYTREQGSSAIRSLTGTKPEPVDYGSHFRAIQEATTEPFAVRGLLISTALLFTVLFLMFPLICIFYEAFASGVTMFFKAISSRETLRALKMTICATAIALPLNVVFGLAAAWCIGKFEFWGKSFLISLIDIPFAISPVIAGLLFVFLFGSQSALGSWLQAHNIRILFALPSVVLATVFVTFPFVVRELIPVMQAQGTEEEQAARVLGARGWQIFWRVTLPNVKWALLYGIILCNARAMGEFGAVIVVAGNSARTNTLPLHINALYQGYADPSAPFAVATLLAVMAILTLLFKTIIEIRLSKSND